MRRFLILFAVIIFSSIYPASAYEYIHTLTNPSGGNEYSVGIVVTDTVTSSTGSFDGYQMKFKWRRPNNALAQISFVNLFNNQYASAFIPDVTGEWTIEAQEFVKKGSDDKKGSDNDKKQDDNKKKPDNRKSKITFTVMEAPEFGLLGAAAPLLLIGLFYIGLRKRML